MQEPCHFYMLPIGGTATAALAGLLHEAGHRVTGVDSALYPPMSEMLAALGVPVRLGYDAGLVPDDADQVIIGNALPRSNIEVEEVLRRGLPYTSQAAALGERFCRDRKAIVVAGTHGKTTTTALIAHILTTAGLDPTALVGGVPVGGRPWRLGRGDWTVVEGDEYNTAFFDRSPKFLHYHPHLFLVGNVEFDHGDIYPDLDAILAAFRAGVAAVAEDGWVVSNGGDGGARAASADARRVVSYGFGAGHDLTCRGWETTTDGILAMLLWRGAPLSVSVPLFGRHNLDNLMAACACALLAGLSTEAVASAAATFPGVRRRLELVGEVRGISVIDDFAHHPTAVGLTLQGARSRHPGRRLVAVFEPRSLTAGRTLFAADYVAALSNADLALLAPVFHRKRLAPEELLDREAVVGELRRRGLEAAALAEDRDPVDEVSDLLRDGDVVLCMSSGDFGNLPRRLLQALREQR